MKTTADMLRETLQELRLFAAKHELWRRATTTVRGRWTVWDTENSPPRTATAHEAGRLYETTARYQSAGVIVVHDRLRPKPGVRYAVDKLVPAGWVRGIRTIDPGEGYNVYDYFRDGIYMGPDDHGVEPVFEPCSVMVPDTEPGA